MTPKRIQLKRTKGWSMPLNTVKVDRSTKWGNPFLVQILGGGSWGVYGLGGLTFIKPTKDEAVASAIRLYRAYLDNDGSQPGTSRDEGGAMLKILAPEELRGKNLACWCREGEPCHADVLLELANAELRR